MKATYQPECCQFTARSFSRNRAQKHTCAAQEMDSDSEDAPLSPPKKTELARKAFKTKDPTVSQLVHNVKVTSEEHRKGLSDSFKSVVYGSLYGSSTSCAVLAAAAASGVSSSSGLVISLALHFGLAMSWGLFDYITNISDVGYARAEMRREIWEYENYPDGEKREMVDIYISKGLSKSDALELVDVLSRNSDIFIDTMMAEELGMLPPTNQPLLSYSLFTAAGFLCCGLLPMLPYIYDLAIGSQLSSLTLFGISFSLTVCNSFGLGALASRWSDFAWWRSAAVMTGHAVGTNALAFCLGWLVSGFVPL
eukprot:TRINITY_DN4949_c0_g1_i1.p2 TRINITY_DN4949_c0_g1~~TRINITY_DN4949_c0_g1_i1.p2  ORF type:complete len:328 (+),score=58.10 TRINITY_DN4949_c0_g1_i1:60-986(+)